MPIQTLKKNTVKIPCGEGESVTCGSRSIEHWAIVLQIQTKLGKKINHMILLFRQGILNSKPGDFRPDGLALSHGDIPHYRIRRGSEADHDTFWAQRHP